ncbi:lactose permease [Colletotrichum spaethianum]|uniref:Lactose permease n=1 Tax=Colletotrichum spaethianum TaxID=700344 RepID=A0AA37LDG5_9PEZI|nr:lactose permease [Colletotrichum spaethianum]GKT44504.1 lactose permease [Colletotrichum spaethianum]
MLVKYHGNGDSESLVVKAEYDEIRQTLDHEKTVQKTDYISLFNTRPNRWRIGITIAVAILTKQYSGDPTFSSSAAQVSMIFLFMGAYSLVWTPLATLYPVEVLSYSMRGNGLGLYNGFVYGTAFLNTFAIPYAMEWSDWGFYLITAFWNILFELPIMYFYFPATEGKTLEEIDEIFEGTTHCASDILVRDILKGEAKMREN